MKISATKHSRLGYAQLTRDLARAYPFLRLTRTDEAAIARETPEPRHLYEFELDASTDMANAWRRVALDELDWPRMTFALAAVVTDDAYCDRTTDNIQNRLWLVPMWYERAVATGGASSVGASSVDPSFKLEVSNTSSQAMSVFASAIIQVAGPAAQWDQRIELLELQPGRRIAVDITVEWGTGAQHTSWSRLAAVRMAQNEYKAALPKSVSVCPSRYRLGFTCDALFDAPVHAARIWRELLRRLRHVHSSLAVAGSSSVAAAETTDMRAIRLSTGRMGLRVEIMGESRTVGNLLSWYVFQLDPDVMNVAAGDDHPEDRSVLVRIVHPEPMTILTRAAAVAIADVESAIRQMR